jgi:L-amino acid N-acyltransferase
MAVLTIRPANPDDLERIFEIYNAQVTSGTATLDTEPRTLERDSDWLTDRDPARHPVLVGVLEGQVIGWAALAPWSNRGAYARTAEASVYVEEAHRSRGYGQQLLARLIVRAREAGLGVLIARIAEANGPSVRLFARQGFDRIGTMHRVGEKLGRVLDVELLELQLDGG